MNLTQFPRINAFLHRVSSGGGAPAAMDGDAQALGALLALEDILLDVVVTGKHELLEEIGQHFESVHGIGAQCVTPALLQRERIASTALGRGVALPHARVAGLERIRPVYLRLKLAIPYDAPDGRPVADVLALLVPKRATQRHLDVLAEAARRFADPDFRDRLSACAGARAVKALFESDVH